ncbi:cytochrome P450 2C25-like [Gastrophryne carolinensis]
MELSAIIALFITFLLTAHALLSWWKSYRQHKSLPPGPTPLPLLGTPKFLNILTAVKNYNELHQQYGPIFTIWKLSEPAVVLCGYETVKDALVNHGNEFSSRPIIPTFHLSSQGYDINGPRWRPLRRFTISSLRNYGMGKKTMESRMLEEAEKLIQAVSDTEGKPFNVTKTLSSASLNIISSALFGERFDYKDPKLHELLYYISHFIRNVLSPLHMFCNTFPILLKLSFVRRIVFGDHLFLQNFVRKYIEEHKRTLKPEDPRDFMDYFLLKIKEVEHEEDPDFCDTSLLMVVVGLFAAGGETTANTLKFCLTLLANYPDVQAKVQQEIDEVTKSQRLPGHEDRPQMPYTNAVIHEMQRVLDLTPTAFFHAVTKDLQFRGYTIPKGTMIIPFISSVLNDPSQWETPEEFNPGHFLDEDGQFCNRAAFMPFSAGKRVCAGENLARMEIFLLLSALLQKFTFKIPPGTERQDTKSLQRNKMYIIMEGQLCAAPRASPTK